MNFTGFRTFDVPAAKIFVAPIFGDFWTFWLVFWGFGGFGRVLEGLGRFGKVLEGFGWFWKVWEGLGRFRVRKIGTAL